MVDTVSLKATAVDAIESGQLESARPLWLKLCELEPAETDNWIILSAIDQNLDFLPAALDHLKYARALSPEDPEVWLQSGKVKWQMSRFAEALGDIAVVLSLDFTDTETRLLMADWCYQCNLFKDALVHYRYLHRCGIDLDHPEIEKAIASALCVGSTGDLVAWTSDECESGDSGLADTVADGLLQIQDPVSLSQYKTLNKPPKKIARFVTRVARRIESRRDEFDWQDYFHRRAHVWDFIHSQESRTPQNFLAEIIVEHCEDSAYARPTVLDVGCGTGLLGDELAATKFTGVITGIDRSSNSIDVANRKNRYDNLVCAAFGRPEDDHLVSGADCIVMADFLEYSDNPVATVRSVTERLTPGSTLFLVWQRMSPDLEEVHEFCIAQGKNGSCIVQALDMPQRTAISLSKSGLDAGAVRTTDHDPGSSLEKMANKLIHASQKRDSRDYPASAGLAGEVLETFPDSSEAMYCKGLHSQDRKDFDTALYYFRLSLKKHRGNPAAWFQIGSVYQQMGKKNKPAIHAYLKCIQNSPGHITATINLSLLLLGMGNCQAAWHYLKSGLLHHPLNTEFIDNCRAVVDKADRAELSGWFGQFMESSDMAKARLVHSLDKKYLRRAADCIDSLDALGFAETETLFYRVQLLEKSGELRQAQSLCRKLVRQDRSNATYWQFLASSSAARGRLKTAHRIWGITATVANPDTPVLQNSLFFSNYCAHVSDAAVSEMHFQWGNGLSKSLGKGPAPSYPADRPRHHKIRIGYVSGDFRMHSVAIFFYNILKYRDREAFEVYCYSCKAGDDHMTTKLRVFSDYWREIHQLDDDAASKLIVRDEIDILVDLAGHTAMNRLPLFCRRPAPIQCTYIGYPNTTGLREIDYRITDCYADPPGMTENLHSEQLVRLPHCFLTYSRHQSSTPVTVKPEKHPTRHYTFACCNNVYKVNDAVIEVWSRILHQLPDARLLIKASNLDNAEIIRTYRRKFEKFGIGSNQVHLMNTIDVNEHQNLYNNVDIALDPFPYNGTTTTCDALWMGVPTLVLAGSRHSGRVGVSILNQLDLTDWIAETEQDYIEKAVRFARDGNLLRKLKLTLRQRMRNSSMMKPGQVTRDLEDAYRKIWKNHQQTAEV